jgi:type VI secretion system secreted protein Hcp
MAYEYFLRIDGIAGESTDARHKDEIVVESFSWGETQTGSFAAGGGAGAGKVAMQDLHVTTQTSKASPPLLLACAAGQRLKSAVLTGRRSGQQQADFFTVTLSDVLVSDYQVSGSEAAAPTDAVSLRFARIVVAYFEQKPDGSLGAPVKAGWDVTANKKV